MVEDDPGDVLITREALAEYKIRNRLVVLSDGLQAIAYLRRQPPFAGVALPDLILLDLNLPGVDGRAVLDTVRADPALAHIPVAVLTASRAEEDVLRSFGLNVELYATKPVDFTSLADIVRRVESLAIRVDKVRS